MSSGASGQGGDAVERDVAAELRAARNEIDRLTAQTESLRAALESAERDLATWKALYQSARGIVEAQARALALARQCLDDRRAEGGAAKGGD